MNDKSSATFGFKVFRAPARILPGVIWSVSDLSRPGLQPDANHYAIKQWKDSLSFCLPGVIIRG